MSSLEHTLGSLLTLLVSLGVLFLLAGAAIGAVAWQQRRTLPLLRALTQRDQQTVEQFAREGRGVHVRGPDGATALMVVAAGEDPALLQSLIARGADVDARRRDGFTALMGAASHGRLENARVLVDAGADVNARDLAGHSALMWAVVCSDTPMARLLLERGANAHLPDRRGETALQLARRKRLTPLVQLLDASDTGSPRALGTGGPQGPRFRHRVRPGDVTPRPRE